MVEKIRLLILGAGTFATEVTDLVSDLVNPSFEVEGYVESLDQARTKSTLLDRPVYWIEDVSRFTSTHLAICAVGSPRRRTMIEQAAEMGMRFATVIHPAARVSRTATIGTGTIIGVASVVASYSEIGNHVIVNRGALIGHHLRIGDYVTISPGANLAGGSTIGDMTYVGMGANVLENLQVGEGAVIGAGSVVNRNVPSRTTVVGVPARSQG